MDKNLNSFFFLVQKVTSVNVVCLKKKVFAFQQPTEREASKARTRGRRAKICLQLDRQPAERPAHASPGPATGAAMTKICRDCGQPFTPARPYYVVCFTCHLARIRKAYEERASLFLPVIPSIARYNRDMTSKPKNKLSILGGDRDEMPG